MSFIKRGDGKIVSVLEEKELTDEQKKIAHDLSKQVVKQHDNEADISYDTKKSGR